MCSYQMHPVVVPIVRTLVPTGKAFFSLFSHPQRHVIAAAWWDWIFPSAFTDLPEDAHSFLLGMS